MWSGFWVRPWQFIATHPVPKTRRMVCVSLLVMNVVNYIFIRLQGHKSWTFVYSIKCSIIQCTHVYSFCKSKSESKVSLSKFYGPGAWNSCTSYFRCLRWYVLKVFFLLLLFFVFVLFLLFLLLLCCCFLLLFLFMFFFFKEFIYKQSRAILYCHIILILS